MARCTATARQPWGRWEHSSDQFLSPLLSRATRSPSIPRRQEPAASHGWKVVPKGVNHLRSHPPVRARNQSGHRLEFNLPYIAGPAGSYRDDAAQSTPCWRVSR